MDELAPDDASATTLRPGAPSEGPVLGPSTRVMCRASPGARALHDAQQGPEVFRPACWRASGQWVIGGRGMHGGVPGPFGPYAATAVHRACWRYVVRGHQSRPILVPLEETAGCLELTATSAEAEALARETASRAWILLQHAALADTRGDHDTTTRLLDAAAAATRAARRQPPATPTSGA